MESEDGSYFLFLFFSITFHCSIVFMEKNVHNMIDEFSETKHSWAPRVKSSITSTQKPPHCQVLLPKGKLCLTS